MDSQIKNTVINSMLIGVSAIGTILAIEVISRLVFGGVLTSEPVLFSNDVIYKPNQVTRYKHWEWDVEIKINSRGFRDFEPEEMTASRSIVVLGDSFTEGYNVSLQNTYAKQLEAQLKKKGIHVNVFNAGHSGTGPEHYRRTFLDYFAADPSVKVVVLGFCFNDFVAPGAFEDAPTSTLGSYAMGPQDDMPFSYHAKVFLGRHSVLYNLFCMSVKSNPFMRNVAYSLGILQKPPMITNIFTVYNKSYIQKYCESSKDFLVAFKDELKDKAIELIVLIIPPKSTVEDETWSWIIKNKPDGKSEMDRYFVSEWFRENLSESQLRIVDMTEVFVNSLKGEGPFYFRYDGHWNAAGHRLAADKLSSSIAPLFK